jgi:sulfane dehydrogenase subunit SoxC
MPIHHSSADAVAGNGLIDRRALLGRGIAIAGGVGTSVVATSTSAAAEPLKEDPWSLEPGSTVKTYQQPSRFEKDVALTLTNPSGLPIVQNARTPHHLLNGMITPNGVHFVISYGGPPDIDPAKHRLVIHGLVKRPLMFTLEALARYPMVSRITFLECGGNSAPLFSPQPTPRSSRNRANQNAS